MKSFEISLDWIKSIPQWAELNHSAQILLVALEIESEGGREFAFTHKTATEYGMTKNTFDRAIKELIDNKLVIKVHKEQQYEPSRFRLLTEHERKGTPGIAIKRLASDNQIPLWMIAKRLGICEASMTRLLRDEVDYEKAQTIKAIIADIRGDAK